MAIIMDGPQGRRNYPNRKILFENLIKISYHIQIQRKTLHSYSSEQTVIT